MSPTRIAAVVLLVVVAGCAGLSGDPGTTTAPTTEPTTLPTTESTDDSTTELPTSDSMSDSTSDSTPTTEPHTAHGTSHTSTHLVVDNRTTGENVTVTLGTGAGATTYDVVDSADLTREVHDRGHDVEVVVERGDETVFEETVRGYEYYEVAVYENDTSTSYVVV